MREAWFVVLLTGLSWAAPEPMSVTLNPRRVTHVLDSNFISININPSDLLQGKPFGISNNSSLSILQGLAPAYVRLGGHDTNRYAFKNTKNLDDYHLTSDYIISEDQWKSINDLLRQTGLDVVVCLNSAFRTGTSQKWDPRNALQLITFSDKQGYNITWELGYGVVQHYNTIHKPPLIEGVNELLEKAIKKRDYWGGFTDLRMKMWTDSKFVTPRQKKMFQKGGYLLIK